MAGLKNRRERLLIWLSAYDQEFDLFTKLGAVQSRVCETNLELWAAIQIKRDKLSVMIQYCEWKMSAVEEECKIAHARFRPVLLKTLQLLGAAAGDVPDDASVEEQLPAYAPRS